MADSTFLLLLFVVDQLVVHHALFYLITLIPLEEVADAVPQVADAVAQVADTVPQAADTVAQVADTVPQAADAVAQAADAVPQVVDAVAQVADAVAQVAATSPSRNLEVSDTVINPTLTNNDSPVRNYIEERTMGSPIKLVTFPYFRKA